MHGHILDSEDREEVSVAAELVGEEKCLERDIDASRLVCVGYAVANIELL